MRYAAAVVLITLRRRVPRLMPSASTRTGVSGGMTCTMPGSGPNLKEQRSDLATSVASLTAGANWLHLAASVSRYLFYSNRQLQRLNDLRQALGLALTDVGDNAEPILIEPKSKLLLNGWLAVFR